MDKKTLAIVILFILIALGLFFLYKQISSLNKRCVDTQVIGMGTTVPAVPKPGADTVKAVAQAPQVVPVALTAQAKTPVAAAAKIPEMAPSAASARQFWGNRGYFTREGKSTFIRYAVQWQMRKEQEAEAKQDIYLK